MKQKWLALLLAALCLLPFPGQADTLYIPENMVEIAAEAFAGCEGITRVVIPDSVQTIGENAFQGLGEAVLLQCGAESPALTYALEHGLDYQADTVYRALLIGQTYSIEGAYNPPYSAGLYLPGPDTDVKVISDCLRRMTGTPYQITVKKNLSREGILNAIRQTFAGATERDVSLLHFSGHGLSNGSLLGYDTTILDYDEALSYKCRITPSALKAVLDEIPGRKVILVDACYSGTLIANGALRSSDTQTAADAFVTSFISAFSAGESSSGSRKSRGALNAPQYFVITAAQKNETSFEEVIEGSGVTTIMGFFAHAICKGCGWLGPEGVACDRFADTNRDGAVSLQEAYAFAAPLARQLSEQLNLHDENGVLRTQNAAVWPADCTWFAPFRWY